MRAKRKSISWFLILIFIFSIFANFSLDIKAVNAANDPKDITPPKGAEINLDGKSGWYAAGYWNVLIDGKMIGNTLAITDKFDKQGITFGGIRNMLHQSTLSSWYNSLTPTPSPIGFYEKASFSKNFSAIEPKIEIITYSARNSARVHIRELAKETGSQVSYDQAKEEVYVTTSPFPTGAITYPSGHREGDNIAFQIRGTSYGGTKIVKYVFSINNIPEQRIDNLYSSSFFDAINYTLKPGQQELKLEITDSAGRTTTYIKNISPGGKPEPPVPPAPTGKVIADFTMPSMAEDWEDVKITNTSIPPMGGSIVDVNWSIRPNTGWDGSLGNNGGTVRFEENDGRNYRVTLTVEDSFGNTDSVTKEIIITDWIPPIPPTEPPVAILSMPSVAMVGDDIDIISKSYDPDGEIVRTEWQVEPNNGMVGNLNSKENTVYFDKTGEYAVTLTVRDNDGLSDTVSNTIIVEPAIPKAFFSWYGTPKENRKIELNALGSYSSARYPIDWSKTLWEVTPPAGGSSNDIKIVSSSALSKRTVLFKKPGDYKIRLRVSNNLETSDWYEETIKIYPDEPPIADFFVMKSITRDPAEGNKARIELSDRSYSPDGDIISKRVWKYRYDSNNDGNFNDESWTVLDSGNNPSPILLADQVGKYEFSLEVEEAFGQESISEFIGAVDRRTANTDIRPLEDRTEDRTTEVMNIAPSVAFSMEKKQKVQIGIIAGDIDPVIRSSLGIMLNNLVKAQLENKNVEIKITVYDAEKITETTIPISAGNGYFTIIKDDGTVWVWGDNVTGIRGDFETTAGKTPFQMIGLNNVKIVSNGRYHSLALKEDGTVWAWRNNTYFQLGDGTKVTRLAPVQVVGLNNVKAISAGQGHSLALKDDGTVWAWGYNNYGQIGDGTTSKRMAPVQVVGLNNVKAISAGEQHSLALKDDGTVWAWGEGSLIGDDATSKRMAPVQVIGLNNVKAISAGFKYSLALKEDGTVWVWGYFPVAPLRLGGLDNIKAISAGLYYYNLTLSGDGAVWETEWEQKKNNYNEWYWEPKNSSKVENINISGGVGNSVAIFPALQNVTWDDYSQHYLMVLSDDEFTDIKDPSGMSKVLAGLLSKNVAVIGLGASGSENQLQSLISQNDGKGVYYSNSNLTTALTNAANYIINQISTETIEQYALLGEEIIYTTYYSDTETDPKYQEQWIYNHNPNIFENSLGLASYHNQGLPLPIISFDKVGSFAVDYKARDNPKNNDRFDEYRLWSASPLDDLMIYVHRKPVAKFGYTLLKSGNNFNIYFSDESYDLDHLSRSDKGIQTKEWKWREAGATSWTNGQPTALANNKTYLISLRVRDLEGAWSDPYVQTVITSDDNLPPIAQFTVSPNPLPIGSTLTHEDFSYDPNGDAITERTWRYQKPDGSWVNNGTVFPSNVYNSLGKYRIELKVRDDKGAWSETFYQPVEVIPDNRKPIAAFTVSPNPLPIDVLAKYTDTSYDPDGDPIVAREWQYQKNEGAWINGQPIDFDTPSLGLGNYNIRLRVKDQPALAQLTAYWSDWVTKALTVVAGNKPPVAQFTVSPNPVASDEPVTYTDTSYDPEGLALDERVWQVRKPDGTVLGEYRNQLPPRAFETTGWGDEGAGTYIIALRVKDKSPNGHSPALWSSWYTQTLVVEDPLSIIGEKEKDTYMAGEAMLLNAFTEGRAYAVEAKMWFKNKHTNTNITQLIPTSTLGNPPIKEMEWRTRRFKDDPGGRDLVVIIPLDTPDGIYQVEFTAYKRGQDGTIKTATDTLTIRVQGVVYDKVYSEIIGGPN